LLATSGNQSLAATELVKMTGFSSVTKLEHDMCDAHKDASSLRSDHILAKYSRQEEQNREQEEQEKAYMKARSLTLKVLGERQEDSKNDKATIAKLIEDLTKLIEDLRIKEEQVTSARAETKTATEDKEKMFIDSAKRISKCL